MKDSIASGASLSQTREVSSSSYAVQSDVDETASVVVTTRVLSSGSEGEVPQQQCVIETQGGGVVGEAIINPGIEVTVETSVSGADAVAGITGM